MKKWRFLDLFLGANPNWDPKNHEFLWLQFIQLHHSEALESILLALRPCLKPQILAWVEEFLTQETPEIQLGWRNERTESIFDEDEDGGDEQGEDDSGGQDFFLSPGCIALSKQ